MDTPNGENQVPFTATTTAINTTSDEGTSEAERHARKVAALCPPWKPGQSGNPKGRPKKGHTIADICRAACDAPAEAIYSASMRTIFPDAEIITNRHVMIARAMVDAIGGDANARDFIAERTDGKVTQKVLTGAIDLEEQAQVLRDMADAEERLYESRFAEKE